MAARIKKKTVFYRVRTRGDNEFEYLEFVPYDPDGEKQYNPLKLQNAKAYAEKIKGWVVKITMEVVFDSNKSKRCCRYCKNMIDGTANDSGFYCGLGISEGDKSAVNCKKFK